MLFALNPICKSGFKKQFEEEDEESRERADEYLRNMKNCYDDNSDNDDDGYSSEEDIPTCNPWRE